MNDAAKRIAAATAIATAIAIPAEGLRQFAYSDTGGILTVCYGHTGKDVQLGLQYSTEQCLTHLNADMVQAINVVEHCAPGLPINVLGAFADVVYNSGPTVVCNRAGSQAARYLAAHDYERACKELPKWNRARVAGVLVPLPGLTKRRQAEMQLCLEG